MAWNSKRHIVYRSVSGGGGGGGPKIPLFSVGSFAKTTSAGPVDQSILLTGFEPKALIIMDVTATSDTTLSGMNLGIGFTDGSAQKHMWSGSEDNVTPSQVHRIGDSDALLSIRNNSTGALLAECVFKSFDADGFTITWTTNDASAYLIKYAVIGGEGIEVEVGSFTQSLVTGTQDVATNLKEANFGIFMSHLNTTEDVVVMDHFTSFGMADDSSGQGHAYQLSNHNQATSNAGRYQRTNSIFSLHDSAGVKLAEADFLGFTSTGFQWNYSINNSAAARVIYYLIVKGGQWQVGNGTTPTVIGTKLHPTRFPPKGVLAFGIAREPSTIHLDDSSFHLGASDGSNDVGVAAVDEDNQALTDNGRTATSSDFMASMSNSATVLVRADIQGGSFNANNFIANYTVVHTSEREFIFAVCGDEGTKDSLLLQNGNDSLLLQNGTDSLLLQE